MPDKAPLFLTNTLSETLEIALPLAYNLVTEKRFFVNKTRQGVPRFCGGIVGLAGEAKTL
jgi:hypothetical protein